jgi:hypothetical protein
MAQEAISQCVLGDWLVGYEGSTSFNHAFLPALARSLTDRASGDPRRQQISVSTISP